MKIEQVDINSITQHPQNPRSGDVKLIEQSILRHGLYSPLVVQKSSRYILVGNHRHKALKNLGKKVVNVVFLDTTDEKAKEILLIDNKTSDNARYDDEKLLELISQVEDTTKTGFTDYEVDKLLNQIESEPLEKNLRDEQLELQLTKEQLAVDGSEPLSFAQVIKALNYLRDNSLIEVQTQTKKLIIKCQKVALNEKIEVKL
jgi:ParB-like chromosome segregation protein Spo0J